MNFRTPNLHIRNVIKSDWKPLNLLRSDPEVRRYNHFELESVEATRTWLNETIEARRGGFSLSHNCSIVLQETGEVIGWIGVGMPSFEKLLWGDLDFGYAIRPQFWNKGYTTEALQELTRYAFRQLKAKSLFGECNVLNRASARVMEKAGLKYIDEYDDADGNRLVRYFIDKQTWKDLQK